MRRGGFWETHAQLSEEACRQAMPGGVSVPPDCASPLRRIDVALWVHAIQDGGESSAP